MVVNLVKAVNGFSKAVVERTKRNSVQMVDSPVLLTAFRIGARKMNQRVVEDKVFGTPVEQYLTGDCYFTFVSGPQTDEFKNRPPGAIVVREEDYPAELAAVTVAIDAQDPGRSIPYRDYFSQSQVALSGEDQKLLDEMFTYHAPDKEQVPRYAAINAYAKQLATCILLNCPHSVDRTEALKLVRSSRMFANSAIAMKGRV